VLAGELRPGDLLVSHDGQRVAVAELYDTGTYERVYNLAIRTFHTYFVCDETWPCSVWAHNSYQTLDELGQQVNRLGRRGDRDWVRVVSNERELKAAWDKLTRGGTKVALTEGHAAKKINEMVDMTIQGRGVRFIYREVSSSGGPAIDIMLKNLRGGFDRWRRIHISQ
jgi:hypothetical protein